MTAPRDAYTTACTLADLARKYRVMLELREAHARGDGIAPRATLAALSREFPSALREIDQLPIEALRDRVRTTALAAEGAAEPALWMHWMCAWHALYRATLATKRALRGDRTVPNDRAADLADALSSRAGITVDAGYVLAVAMPPARRLTPLVLTTLAAHFSTDGATIAAAIFADARAPR